ncbi:MAG: type II toxin-antitoxin system HipA family toxin [Arcobacter sp.]|nr:type II toxin-antitoxin system HipA family toxin [Arcobacter sp.]
MSKLVEVKLWGTTIGYIAYPKDSNIAQFEYDEKFMSSNIYPSPLLMKYPPTKFYFEDISFRTFKGIAGVFADSLPDKFGNQLIDQFMAEKKIPQENITTLDRLLYVGKRGMGALEYHPTEFEDDLDISADLDITLLSNLAELVISKKDALSEKLENSRTKQDALNLIKVGSSAGGARAKALVARNSENKLFDGTSLYEGDYTYWLLKFDSSSNKDRDSKDPKGMTRVEYIYSIIATKCGINMPKTDYIIDKDEFHFMIERFDRVISKGITSKVHYLSWAGLSHFDRDATGAYSYEQLILNIRQLGFGQDEVEEVFRRAVFNIVGRNQDDHTKNFGFIMNKKGEWKLSPAFDMTYSYDPTGKWTKEHQIKLNGKQDKFTKDDVVEFGKYCNLTKIQATKILEDTKSAFKDFENLANKYKVDEELKQTILNNLRLQL